jgi:HEAT repeat protein
MERQCNLKNANDIYQYMYCFNLGKFKSLTVIGALRDLLTDKDVNVQAVAIISLARTGAHDIDTIVALRKCLRAKDRIVREAACLSLGHLGVDAAIEELVNLW